jgi:hypothetical protein
MGALEHPGRLPRIFDDCSEEARVAVNNPSPQGCAMSTIITHCGLLFTSFPCRQGIHRDGNQVAGDIFDGLAIECTDRQGKARLRLQQKDHAGFGNVAPAAHLSVTSA